MSFDLARARAETPGSANVAHFNNAGAALPPKPVLEAVTAHLEREAAIGGYEAAAEAEPQIEHAYDALARLLNCAPDEVAVVENATRAWDMAFYAFPFRSGDRILTAEAEYASNYIAYLQVQRRSGVTIETVPSDDSGALSTVALERMIDDRVKLIAITHVPTNGGLVNPAAEVGRVARTHGIPYLLDACQSVGQMPVDVAAIGCDMLSATGRKYLRGPRGTGFLYVGRELLERLEPPFLDMRGATWTAPDDYRTRADARRFETWEDYVAGKIGLGVAADYALAWGLEAIGARITGLAGDLRRRLDEIQRVSVRDIGRELCGIVSFTVEGCPAAEVEARLRAQGINVSVSEPSSTLLDARRRHLPDLVRASVHYYNSEDEVTRLVEAVAGLARCRASRRTEP